MQAFFAVAMSLAVLSAATAQPLTPVTVGMTGTTTDVGLYVAHKKGFFSDEKLDVKLTIFDSAARMITLFASGALDVGGGGPSAGLYNAVARGVDILVATPGRLLDHVGTNAANLGQVEIVVLDEADRMLDMGFIHAIRKLEIGRAHV